MYCFLDGFLVHFQLYKTSSEVEVNFSSSFSSLKKFLEALKFVPTVERISLCLGLRKRSRTLFSEQELPNICIYFIIFLIYPEDVSYN